MNPLNITRAVMGSIILVGLLFFKPLAYVAASMMVLSGIMGV